MTRATQLHMPVLHPVNVEVINLLKANQIELSEICIVNIHNHLIKFSEVIVKKLVYQTVIGNLPYLFF
jgi:hypothetical protein